MTQTVQANTSFIGYNHSIMIYRRFFILILSLSLLSLDTLAVTQAAPEKNLNEVMTNIAKIMTTLFPLIYTEKVPPPKRNREIYQLVNELATQFEQAGPLIQKKSPTYQMSYQILQDYLNTIIVEDKPFALQSIRSRLSSLSDFCISCHTQDNKFRTLFRDNKKRTFESHLTQAEFNYATRNYHEAHIFYEKYLVLTPGLKDSDILKALFRIISIYTQILNQPDVAVEALIKLEKENIFSNEIQKYIKESKQSLEELVAINANEKHLVSFKELQDYVTQFLGNVNAGHAIVFTTSKEEIERLWLRGLLFRYLNSSPERKEMPYILYWLALCDRSLGHGYDYTLADFYIKQCITRYSDHPLAQTCFNEYKDYLTFYYTTPTEPVIPFEVDFELKELESFLKKKR